MWALLGAAALFATASCSSEPDVPDTPDGPDGGYKFPVYASTSLAIGDTDTFSIKSEHDFYIAISDAADRNLSSIAFTMNEQNGSSSITKDERFYSAGSYTFEVTAEAASYDEEYACTVWMRIGNQTEKIRDISLRKIDRQLTLYTAALDDDGHWTSDQDNNLVFTKLAEGGIIEYSFNKFDNKNTFEARIKVETNVDSWSFTDNTPDWVTTELNGNVCALGVDYSKLTEDQLKGGVSGKISIQDTSAGNSHAVMGTFDIALPAADDINYAYFNYYDSNPVLIFMQNGMYDNGNTVVDNAQGVVVGFNTSFAVAADSELWSKDDIKIVVSDNADGNKMTSDLTLSVANNSGYNRTAYILAFTGKAPADIITPDDAETKYADNIIASISQQGPLGRADGWIIQPYDEDLSVEAGAKFERLDNRESEAAFVSTIQNFNESFKDIQVYRLTYKRLTNFTPEGWPMPVSNEAAFKIPAGYGNFTILGHLDDAMPVEKAVISEHNYPTTLLFVTTPESQTRSGYYCLNIEDSPKEKSWGGLWIIIGEDGSQLAVIDLWFDPDAEF